MELELYSQASLTLNHDHHTLWGFLVWKWGWIENLGRVSWEPSLVPAYSMCLGDAIPSPTSQAELPVPLSWSRRLCIIMWKPCENPGPNQQCVPFFSSSTSSLLLLLSDQPQISLFLSEKGLWMDTPWHRTIEISWTVILEGRRG